MSRVNFLPSAVAIVFVDSGSSQCKTRQRVTTGVRKRNASTECHSWRVSEAFTRCSSNLSLFAAVAADTISTMATAILLQQQPNSSWIRPKFWTFLLKGPKIGPNSR